MSPLLLKELPKLHKHTANEAKHHCDVLDAIAENPGISREEISRRVNVSPSRVSAYLTQFLADGTITRQLQQYRYAYFLAPLEE